MQNKIAQIIQKKCNDSSLLDVIFSDNELYIYGDGLQSLFICDFFDLIEKKIFGCIANNKNPNHGNFIRRKLLIHDLSFLPENVAATNILVCVNSLYNREIRSDLTTAGWKNVFTVDDWDSVNAQISIISNEIKFLLFKEGEIRNVPGVVSLLGGSFKQFFAENNGKEKIEILKNGLDSNSMQVIDHAVFKMLHYPEDVYSQYYYLDVKRLESIVFDTSLANYAESYASHKAAEFNSFRLSGSEDLNPEVFLSHHGLNYAPESVKDYIKHKDVIDCGAYVGDSALMFINNYEINCVHSFELSKRNCEHYVQTMKLNNVVQNKFILNHAGIAEEVGECAVRDTGGQGVNLHNTTGANLVKLVSVDSYVKNNRGSVRPGFIKCDIEGYCLKGLKGMKATILKDLPVLSLAINHSPEEFFEVKPLLEQITCGGYVIEIKDSEASLGASEVYLFAYPKFLQ